MRKGQNEKPSDPEAELAKWKAKYEKVEAELAAAEAERHQLIAELFTRRLHELIRQSCAGTGVDGDLLILKLPPLPTEALTRYDFARYLNSVAEKLVDEEREVYQRAADRGFDSIWQAIKKTNPNLPEFAD